MKVATGPLKVAVGELVEVPTRVDVLESVAVEARVSVTGGTVGSGRVGEA
jgi:hypothetical protein